MICHKIMNLVMTVTAVPFLDYFYLFVYTLISHIIFSLNQNYYLQLLNFESISKLPFFIRFDYVFHFVYSVNGLIMTHIIIEKS